MCTFSEGRRFRVERRMPLFLHFYPRVGYNATFVFMGEALMTKTRLIEMFGTSRKEIFVLRTMGIGVQDR